MNDDERLLQMIHEADDPVAAFIKAIEIITLYLHELAQ